LRTQLEEKERYLLAIKVVISRAASENGYNTHNNIKEGHPGPPTTHIHTHTKTYIYNGNTEYRRGWFSADIAELERDEH